MAELSHGAKVTWPTRPWMTAAPSSNPSQYLAQYAHAPSFHPETPDIAYALCKAVRFLDIPRPDLPRCPRCIDVLSGHGLWPL